MHPLFSLRVGRGNNPDASQRYGRHGPFILTTLSRAICEGWYLNHLVICLLFGCLNQISLTFLHDLAICQIGKTADLSSFRAAMMLYRHSPHSTDEKSALLGAKISKAFFISSTLTSWPRILMQRCCDMQ